MTRRISGPLLAALPGLAVLAGLAIPAGAAAPDALEVVGAGGAVIALVEIPAGSEWCLHWRHSVSGGPVADCFRFVGGQMLLERSYLHDFAAGLGHIPGRGVQSAAAGGGYWIDAIGEPVAGNALALRVGSAAVGHRIEGPDWRIDLSATMAGARVILRPASGNAPR